MMSPPHALYPYSLPPSPTKPHPSFESGKETAQGISYLVS